MGDFMAKLTKEEIISECQRLHPSLKITDDGAHIRVYVVIDGITFGMSMVRSSEETATFQENMFYEKLLRECRERATGPTVPEPRRV